MSVSFTTLLSVKTKFMSAPVAYDMVCAEAAKQNVTSNQYVAYMKQHINLKDKEFSAYERQLIMRTLPHEKRANAIQKMDECKEECLHLNIFHSLYTQHYYFLRDAQLLKPNIVKKTIKPKKVEQPKVEQPKIMVEPVTEEDEWEMNAANFAI